MSSDPPPWDDLPPPDGDAAEGLPPPTGAIVPPPPPLPPPPPGPGLPAPPGGWIDVPSDLPPPPPGYPPTGGYAPGGGYASGGGYPPGGGAPPGAGYSAYRPYTPAMRPPSTYAGFWARFGTFFIDGLVCGVVPFIIRLIGQSVVPKVPVACTGINRSAFSCIGPDPAKFLPWQIASIGLNIVLIIVFVIVPIGRTGRSVGGRVTKVRVVDASSGQPIGVGRALARWIVSILSGCVCYLGFLWMLWDDRKQTWHDKATSTIVVSE